MIVKYYRLIPQLGIMQPAPGPPVQAQNPQPIQPMQPMQPMAAYQPQPKFLDKYGTYSFSKWLMIGIVIIVIGAMFAQVTDLVGAPNPADYERDGVLDASKYAEDQFSHEKLGTSLDALSSMLQSVGMGLIAYALLREANQGDAHHTAVRVTAVITGVLLVGNIAAANLSIL